MRLLADGMYTEQLAVRRWLAVVFILDAVFDREFGADQCAATHVHQIAVVVQRPDDMTGELGGFGGLEDTPELFGLTGDDFSDTIGQE